MNKYNIINNNKIIEMELTDEQLELHYYCINKYSGDDRLYKIKDRRESKHLHIVKDSDSLKAFKNELINMKGSIFSVKIKNCNNFKYFEYYHDNVYDYVQHYVLVATIENYENFIHGMEFSCIIYEAVEGISDEFNDTIKKVLRNSL